MILCVTLNPCLDKTLTVPSWRPGDLVRGVAVREVVGGKGNNVARALKRLGRTARPVTFLGGSVGQYCGELLVRDDGLDPIIVATEAPTRVILTVLTQSTTDQTAFFDPDPAITPAEAAAAERAVGLVDSPAGAKMLAHLRAMTARFKEGLVRLGFETLPGEHPVVPLMLRDTARTAAMVAHLRRNGILATGLNYPVVPRGDEEIRFQVSADHTEPDIDAALAALAAFTG